MCGKTRDLILKSASLKIPIVCPTNQDADRILNTAQHMNVHIPCPLPLISQGRLMGYSDYCLVDDADRILQMIIKAQIKEATFTTEAEYPISPTNGEGG